MRSQKAHTTLFKFKIEDLLVKIFLKSSILKSSMRLFAAHRKPCKREALDRNPSGYHRPLCAAKVRILLFSNRRFESAFGGRSRATPLHACAKRMQARIY